MTIKYEATREEILNDLSLINGVSEVEYYTLINNYGATFKKNGKKYDLRRWANCYGVDCGWGVFGYSGDDYNEAIEAIKKI